MAGMAGMATARPEELSPLVEAWEPAERWERVAAPAQAELLRVEPRRQEEKAQLVVALQVATALEATCRPQVTTASPQ